MQYVLIPVAEERYTLVDANELYALHHAKEPLNELPCDDAYEATLERHVVYGAYKPQDHFHFPKSEVKRHMREVIDKWLVHLDGLDVHHLGIEDIEIMDVDIMRSCGHCPKPHLSSDIAFAALVLLPPSLKLGNGKTQAKTAYLKWLDMDVLTTLLNRKGLFSLIAAEKRFKQAPTLENWREFIDPKRAVKYAQRHH